MMVSFNPMYDQWLTLDSYEAICAAQEVASWRLAQEKTEERRVEASCLSQDSQPKSAQPAAATADPLILPPIHGATQEPSAPLASTVAAVATVFSDSLAFSASSAHSERSMTQAPSPATSLAPLVLLVQSDPYSQLTPVPLIRAEQPAQQNSAGAGTAIKKKQVRFELKAGQKDTLFERFHYGYNFKKQIFLKIEHDFTEETYIRGTFSNPSFKKSHDYKHVGHSRLTEKINAQLEQKGFQGKNGGIFRIISKEPDFEEICHAMEFQIVKTISSPVAQEFAQREFGCVLSKFITQLEGGHFRSNDVLDAFIKKFKKSLAKHNIECIEFTLPVFKQTFRAIRESSWLRTSVKIKRGDFFTRISVKGKGTYDYDDDDNKILKIEEHHVTVYRATFPLNWNTLLDIPWMKKCFSDSVNSIDDRDEWENSQRGKATRTLYNYLLDDKQLADLLQGINQICKNSHFIAAMTCFFNSIKVLNPFKLEPPEQSHQKSSQQKAPPWYP